MSETTADVQRQTSSWGSFVAAWFRASELLASVIFLFAFFLQLYALILRYFFNTGITQATEVGKFAVVAICFLGMVRGFDRREHIRFSGLVTRLPPLPRTVLRATGDALTLAMLGVIGYTGVLMTLRYAHLYLRAVTMTWFPLWVLILTIPLGAILSVFAVLHFEAGLLHESKR